MSDVDDQRARTRQSFLWHSTYYRVSSPLFSALAQSCATDDEIVDLCLVTRRGQASGLLIFYVVQYLLLKSPDAKLSRYFPSLSSEPLPATEAFPFFREFCLERRSEVAELLSWRTVNTNLPEKASALVAALSYLEGLTAEPLTLLELCCSAGLNMLFDEYHYDYGEAGCIGVENSPVQLKCRIVGAGQPPVEAMPRVARRLGVDLVKVDPSDPLERLWMEAVLCPEWHIERRRLRAALSIRTKHNLQILRGDALDVVPQLVEELPGTLCILMSYCIGHWSSTARAELDEVLRRASRQRDIHRLGIEMPDSEPSLAARTRLRRLAKAGIPMLHKSSPSRIDHTWYANGQVSTQLLGEGDAFGVWLDWHAPRSTLGSARVRH